MAGKASKTNLHRSTLRACLRVIDTGETLDQARIQLTRILNVFDKLEAQNSHVRTRMPGGVGGGEP
jgi:hypothetical protein